MIVAVGTLFLLGLIVAIDRWFWYQARHTDLKNLKATLDKVGIVYTQTDSENQTTLEVHEGDGPNNLGYNHHTTFFFFSSSGTLRQIGAYE